MLNKLPIESLHTHTTLSDGKLSHKELFELASSLDISVLAFTDHDALPSDTELSYLESVREEKTKWIIGIEISAGLPKELANESNGGLHIIGLFTDPKNHALIEYCAQAKLARIKLMEEMVKNLTKLGFTVTKEDCLQASGGESVGRPHVVEALASHPENKAIVEELRKKMEMDSEHDTVLRQKYDEMMEKGERQFPYTLFLSTDSYISTYTNPSFGPDLDEAVALIRGAGGIASVAHYFTVKNKMPLPFIENLLKEKRVDGMETIYGLWNLGGSREEEMKNDQAALRQHLKTHGGLETGGSDAHKPEDLIQYASLQNFSKESIGMSRKIIDSGRINPKWSSFSR